MTTKKFIPQFLFKDEIEIKKEERRVSTGAKQLNEFIEKVKSALHVDVDVELSDVEKENIKTLGMKFIYDSLKFKYQFPNASNEFNLQALGIDIKPLERFYNRYHASWLDYDYKLNKDGIFEATNKTISKASDKHIFFTTNEKQNEALKLAKELELLFSSVKDAGHLKSYHLNNISDISGLLNCTYKNPNISPDYYYIKNIK